MEFEKAVVFGLGYIGLPTAVLLAEHGVNVLGVDVLDTAVNAINAGEMHIVEPGLKSFLSEAVRSGKLHASHTPAPADVFILAVPSPFKEKHKPDLSYIKAACDALAPYLRKGNLVILESTSPVGTTAKVGDWLAEKRLDLTFPGQAGEDADIQIAHCPERVLPGKVVHEMVENDRIIGGLSKKAAQMAASFYRIFVRGELALTDAKTAEMCKLTENSFRDVNIAFANELSMICDKLGIDTRKLIKLANLHPRVKILNPGCGVGGHCIAVDPWFIVDSVPEEARLIATAREVNDSKPQWLLKRIKKLIQPLQEKKDFRIACLGLVFKPDIDDLRESPALKIAQELAKAYPGHVLLCEPNIKELPKGLISLDCRLAEPEEAWEADLVIALVAHRQFKHRDKPKTLVVDAAGLWQ